MHTTDFEAASAALATMLVNERQAHEHTREQFADLSRFMADLFAGDRETLLANGTFTFLDGNGEKVTLDELVEQRDSARRFAQAWEVDSRRAFATLAAVRALCDHWHAVGKADGVSARHANELETALHSQDDEFGDLLGDI